MGKDLLNLGVWWDQATESAKAVVTKAASEVRLEDPCRVLPLEFAAVPSKLKEKLEDGTRKAVATPFPFYFASLGDAELALATCGYPGNFHQTQERLRICGLSRKTIGLRNEFVTALREAPLLGLHQHWLPVTHATALGLSLCGFEMPPATAVEVGLPYQMLKDGTLFELLKGKRVVIIGDKARSLSVLMKNRSYIKAHSHLGPIGENEVVDFFTTHAKSPDVAHADTAGSWVDLEGITQWAGKTDFDVALLACGGIATIVGHRLWKMGKASFDIGFVLEALIGNQKRSTRPILCDIKWPNWPE